MEHFYDEVQESFAFTSIVNIFIINNVTILQLQPLNLRSQNRENSDVCFLVHCMYGQYNILLLPMFQTL